MSDLPEHVRIEIPEVIRLDEVINGLHDQLRAASGQRQQLIDTEAQRIAQIKVGYEYEGRKGKRYRITKVKGEYTKYDHVKEPIIWVRYYGIQLFKKGTESSEQKLYPSDLPIGVLSGNQKESSKV